MAQHNERPSASIQSCQMGRRTEDGILQPQNEIRGGKKERRTLARLGRSGKWHGCAGKKNQGEPDELIEDLSLLHGVGDAGDDETHRGEGNRRQW